MSLSDEERNIIVGLEYEKELRKNYKLIIL